MEGYSVILIGGSIGSKSIRNLRDIKGMKAENVTFSYEEAKAQRRDANKTLSPGEKSYYGMRYKIARSENNIYTGR